MALHDTDRRSDNRLTPSPNADDDVMNRMAHNTTSTTYRKVTDSTTKQRVVFKNGLILTYDSANRVSSVYGYIPSLSDIPVLIIAKSGYDVFSDVLGITAPTV